jgi:FMN reductase
MVARVVVVSGSPSASSRTLRLLRHIGARLSDENFDVTYVEVRDLPPDDLVFARAASPALAAPLATIASAAGIVVGTPVYKAAYTGLLKTFLDLLPPRAFAGKIVLPLMTGGTSAHALALDYALRPVLMALGGPLVVGGAFVLDQHVGEGERGVAALSPEAEGALTACILAFSRALGGPTSNG